MKVKVKRLLTEKIYVADPISFFVDKIKINNVNTIREYVNYPEAAGVIPVTSDNKIIMVKQYRYTNRYYSLEIPAGKKDKSETFIQCARRELLEETGYYAKKFTKLITYYPAISYSTERLHIYVAKGLTKKQAKPDSDEFLDTEILSLKSILNLIKQNKIMDSKTILSILLYYYFIDIKSI